MMDDARMEDLLQRTRDAFHAESGDLLLDIEEALMRLDEDPSDTEALASAFRGLHTIKGSSGLAGYDAVEAFAHELEDALDRVRAGELGLGPELVELVLVSADHLRGLIEAGAEPSKQLREAGDSLLSRLGSIPGAGTGASGEPVVEPATTDDSPQSLPIVDRRVRFRPHPDLLVNGGNPRFLFEELRELGDLAIAADTSAIPPLDDLVADRCYVSWELSLRSAAPEADIRNVFVFVEDGAELAIERAVAGSDSAPPGDVPQNSARPQEDPALAAARERAGAPAASLRVPADKLDRLVDLVGELVIAQARLAGTADRRGDDELQAIAEQLERLTADLRDSTLSIRMLPIGTTFNRFRRLVRDLSRDLDKEVELVTEGGDTELDKTVIERLGDPLVHLIRNALDHGIESPTHRETIGKSRRGRVRLAAVHSGGRVLVEVSDDGAGLDREAIRRKAIQRGILAANAEPDDRELLQLVFTPGFSTAAAVTNLSGRGVGLDAVKASVEALGGSVEIDSSPGTGTRFVMSLPLTLAIIDGLLVEVGGDSHVIPLSAVEECLEVRRQEIEGIQGRRLIQVRGELVPFVPLSELFEVVRDGPESSRSRQCVITRVDGQRYGFLVDDVIGQYQTVIKSLGRLYEHVHGVSGATILGDGSVALILEPGRLVQAAQASESGAKRRRGQRIEDKEPIAGNV